ncbi:hypothetical protein TWF694_002563 [Orbilia ellipsospora]|uniref:WIBG Mago-binding domain-containing protein n=1 Tax=Orbilia ellipsospora TaxID=2528407 RepID=A0AAV9X3K3_9PEZI
MSSKEPQTTTSGIQTLASGSRIIPSSVRADGSTRPERRVKPGFTPAEDIAKYQNRTAEAWRNRGTGGVPGATEVPGAGPSEKSGGAKKKRSRKKKGTGAGGDDEKDDEGEEGVDVPVDNAKAPEAEQSFEQKTADDTAAAAAADTEKKAKGLQKKIRQAQELKSRKDKGETLLPEQLDKALRLGELIRDLEKLGIKYEG